MHHPRVTTLMHHGGVHINMKGNDNACSAGEARVRVSVEIMEGCQLKGLDPTMSMWSSRDTQSSASSDPYIRVYMRTIGQTRATNTKWKSEKFTTPVIKHNLNPDWTDKQGHGFLCQLTNNDPHTRLEDLELRFKVLDKDASTCDDVIGIALLPLANVLQLDEFDDWIHLQHEAHDLEAEQGDGKSDGLGKIRVKVRTFGLGKWFNNVKEAGGFQEVARPVSCCCTTSWNWWNKLTSFERWLYYWQGFRRNSIHKRTQRPTYLQHLYATIHDVLTDN